MSKVISVLEIVAGIVVGVVAGWTGVGAYYAAMLIAAGVTGLAASYLAPGAPSVGRSDHNAPVQHISVDPDAYGTLVYGEAKCGGVMIYQNVCSSDGSQTYDILDYVVAHCFTDLTRGVEHMGAIYINDQLIPESSIDGSGNVTSGDFAGMVQVWRYDGTQTAADPVLRSAYGSDPEFPWPSTAIGKGICYTHYRFKSGTDQDKFNRAFSGGPPHNVATVIKGEKPYDPRTSAYAYSENPAICLRDFMTRADNGAGVPATYLDATMLAASANICDEVITYPDGTTTGPRFKCDGAIGLGDSRKAIIGDILASMAGEVIQSNGLLSVRSGSYTPPSGALTEDFLSGAATSSEPTQDMRYNHVLTNYIGPKSNWQNVQAPAYPALSSSTYAAWLAQDGTRLDKQLGLKMVTNPENAQVIEQIVGNQSRYMRGVSMQCNAKALAFTTGDRVTLNIPECGEVNEIFKITGMRLRPDFGADVQLVADDPSIYGWDNVIAVDVPGLPLPGTKYSAPPVVTGFVCKPQADGIGIAWTAPDVNKVDLTEVQRGTASAGPFTVIYRGFGNSLVDHLPDDDSTYYYRARNYLGGTYSVFTTVQSQAGKIVSTAADVDAMFAAIASDNILSAGEKPQVITSNTTIVNEQAGIDAQATAYGVTSEQTAYDNALSALQSYLATLTTPKAWNDVGGDTTIVGLTFRAKFTGLYDARQTLLNAIYAAAKALADGAQNTADDAHTIATANSGNLDNSRFVNGLTGWIAGTGWAAGVNRAVYTGYSGATGLSNSVVNTILVPTAAGQRVSVQAMLTATGATGACEAAISWYDSTQGFIGGSFGNTVTGTQGATLSRITDTAPANAAYCAAAVVAYSGTAGSYTASYVAITLFPANVDELPDGSTYGRTLGGWLNGNRPVIDFQDNFHLNKNLGNIADYSGRYAVSSVDANSRALIDFGQGGHVNKVLDNIGDGTTYERMPGANMDGNRRALIDFGQGGHVNKVLDNIGDGSTYIRSPLASGTGSGLVIPNADFSLGAGSNVPGLVGTAGTYSLQSGGPNGTTNYLLVTNPSSPGSYVGPSGSERVTCTAGDVLSLTCAVWGGNVGSGGAVAAGYNFYNAAGGLLGNCLVFASIGGGWQTYATSGTAPGGTAYAQRVYVVNSSSSASQHAGFSTMRASINDVRVAGSGASLGDSRNSPAYGTAGFGGAWGSGSLSYNGSASSMTISAASGQLYNGSWHPTYNAASTTVSGTAGSTDDYYLYYDDAAQAGGSQTLHATTDRTVLAQADGRVTIGEIGVTFPSSGTGGGTGNPSCVQRDSWLRVQRDGSVQFMQAKDMVPVRRGDMLRAADPATGREWWQQITAAALATNDGVCVTCANGTELQCSANAILGAADGSRIRADQTQGQSLYTSTGASDASVTAIGPITVVQIMSGGVFFLAGMTQSQMLAHHNMKPA